MTRRGVALHLGAAAALLLIILGAYFAFHSALAVPRLIRSLEGDDPRARRRAIASLAGLGPQAAQPAVAALQRLAQPGNPFDDRTSATAALVEIAPSVAFGLVPVYTAALLQPDARVRYQAAMVLAELGPVGKSAAPDLVTATRDSHELVRRWAVNALGRIAPAGPDVTQALVTALDDPSEGVRHDALLAFSYGALPREALQQAAPALRRMQADRRHAAISAAVLREMEQPLEPAVELLVNRQMLKARGKGRRYALQKLSRMGPTASPALNDVVAILRDGHPLNRYLAVETLAAMGPTAAPALPALRGLHNDDDALVRAAAATAIERIGAPPAAAATEAP